MTSSPDTLSACVYCGASRRVRKEYLDAAELLGQRLAEARVDVVYGGGASGMMGALASAALAAGGNVHGVRPRLAPVLEIEHRALTSMTYTDDLGTRKQVMWARSSVIVVLPGGSGTVDELLEAVTQKRLGVHRLPIVIVNVAQYFDRLLEFLHYGVKEGFIDAGQFALWHTAGDVSSAMPHVLAGGR